MIIRAITNSVLERLEQICSRNYVFCDWKQSGEIFFSIEWSEPVKNPRLKQQAPPMEIRFYDDRAVYNIMEFSMFTAYYCDPSFPDDLINYLRKGMK